MPTSIAGARWPSLYSQHDTAAHIHRLGGPPLRTAIIPLPLSWQIQRKQAVPCQARERLSWSLLPKHHLHVCSAHEGMLAQAISTVHSRTDRLA